MKPIPSLLFLAVTQVGWAQTPAPAAATAAQPVREEPAESAALIQARARVEVRLEAYQDRKCLLTAVAILEAITGYNRIWELDHPGAANPERYRPIYEVLYGYLGRLNDYKCPALTDESLTVITHIGTLNGGYRRPAPVRNVSLKSFKGSSPYASGMAAVAGKREDATEAAVSQALIAFQKAVRQDLEATGKKLVTESRPVLPTLPDPPPGPAKAVD